MSFYLTLKNNKGSENTVLYYLITVSSVSIYHNIITAKFTDSVQRQHWTSTLYFNIKWKCIHATQHVVPCVNKLIFLWHGKRFCVWICSFFASFFIVIIIYALEYYCAALKKNCYFEYCIIYVRCDCKVW